MLSEASVEYIMTNHEYIVICGFNRSKVGRILAICASAISALLIFLLLKLAEVLHFFHFDSHLPPSIFSLLGAGTIYLGLYKWFDTHLWCYQRIGKILSVPNLSGKWVVEGKSLSDEGRSWDGELTIVQSWDKVRIHLKTLQSHSDSITASIIHDEGIGYRLLYNYRNQPKLGEEHLRSHIGFADLRFDQTLSMAEGEYFNGHGRTTFGSMIIRKKSND